jgi:RalA-binding protein 1
VGDATDNNSAQGKLKWFFELCNFHICFVLPKIPQRKLRTFEKRHDSMQKSMDMEAVEEAIDFTLQTTETAAVVEVKPEVPEATVEEVVENPDHVFVTENGFLMLHKDHPDYLNLIRLQLENQQLMEWKQQLQAKINFERSECVRLKRLAVSNEATQEIQTTMNPDEPEFERIVEHFIKENSLLEQKRILLQKEILDENISLIQLQVELAMKQFVH